MTQGQSESRSRARLSVSFRIAGSAQPGGFSSVSSNESFSGLTPVALQRQRAHPNSFRSLRNQLWASSVAGYGSKSSYMDELVNVILKAPGRFDR